MVVMMNTVLGLILGVDVLEQKNITIWKQAEEG